MLEQIRSLIAAALDERDASQEAVEAILALAEEEGRSEMTADETEKFDAARAELREIDDKIAGLQAREIDLVDLASRSEKAAEARKEVLPMNIKVVSEEKTYRADSEHDFLSDAIAAKFGNDSAAADRLARARDEALSEYRSTSGNYGGLVVPQYLTEQFAATLASGRPFLEAVTKVALPAQGMNMVIPRGATTTGVAAQTTEGTAVTNQTFTESDLTVPVRTFAGQQVVSRQSIDRGTGIGGILLADLYQQYATKVNVSALSGDGTAGGHWVSSTRLQCRPLAGLAQLALRLLQQSTMVLARSTLHVTQQLTSSSCTLVVGLGYAPSLTRRYVRWSPSRATTVSTLLALEWQQDMGQLVPSPVCQL